jgi:hypothetical protein
MPTLNRLLRVIAERRHLSADPSVRPNTSATSAFCLFASPSLGIKSFGIISTNGIGRAKGPRPHSPPTSRIPNVGTRPALPSSVCAVHFGSYRVFAAVLRLRPPQSLSHPASGLASHIPICHFVWHSHPYLRQPAPSALWHAYHALERYRVTIWIESRPLGAFLPPMVLIDRSGGHRMFRKGSPWPRSSIESVGNGDGF